MPIRSRASTSVRASLIPDRQREHAVEALGEFFAPLLPSVDQHFGIGMVRAEAVSLGLEFATQFAMVIDFAVEDDPDRPVLVRIG